jgi:DNA-binding NtrC family response regulator
MLVEDSAEGTLPYSAGEIMTPNLVGNSILAIERELILQTLEYCAGNRTHAAKLLKISLRALRYKLRHYEAQGFSAAKITPWPGEGKPAGSECRRSSA